MKILRETKRALGLIAALIVLLGLAYPLVVTGLGRVAGSRADGQIIYRGGEAVGSRAIGQRFESNGFFQGRPSAAGDGYDAMRSGGSNLGPSNPDLTEEARDRIFELLERNPGLRTEDIPVELVTASASGLDPDISEESAVLQIPRIAEATGLGEEALRELVAANVKGSFLGIFGEPTVNVLVLNLGILEMTEGVEK
jgi:potassium-transporting ATPase KdpC subunit